MTTSEKNNKLISLTFGILGNVKDGYLEFTILNLNFLAYSHHDTFTRYRLECTSDHFPLI